MVGLNLGGTLSVGLLVLALHLVSVTLTRALRTYSRSRLEDLCARRGHPARADEVAHLDEPTERAAETLAVVTGLMLAALLGATADRVAPRQTAVAVVGIALVIGALGLRPGGDNRAQSSPRSCSTPSGRRRARSAP